jgi:hypothetical protein
MVVNELIERREGSWASDRDAPVRTPAPDVGDFGLVTFRARTCASSIRSPCSLSRNRHDGDRTAPQFLAEVGTPATIRLSAVKRHGSLSLAALDPTAIQNHLSVRVIRQPLQQNVVQCRMPQGHDE